MSNITSDNQGKYISYEKAMKLLNVRFDRITWLIATGELSSRINPQDRSKKIVSLQDIYRLRDNSPYLLAPWIIYALVDPRNDEVRYIGRTYEPQIRLRGHLNDIHASNPDKYQWIQELKREGLLPCMNVLDGLKGTIQDADLRERLWIQYFINAGANLTNIQYTGKKVRNTYRDVISYLDKGCFE